MANDVGFKISQDNLKKKTKTKNPHRNSEVITLIKN